MYTFAKMSEGVCAPRYKGTLTSGASAKKYIKKKNRESLQTDIKRGMSPPKVHGCEESRFNGP